MSLKFQWNAQKAIRNKKKHRVTFTEAATVFQDPLALIFDDEEHSEAECREIIVGHSNRNRILVVSFTERHNVIRMISARKADRGEREDYGRTKR
jgi:uncharacterized protein